MVPPECRKRIRGKVCYRYNMYLLHIDPRGLSIFFLAVPYLRMALEVYPYVKAQGRGRQFAYQAVDLALLVAAVAENRNRGGSLEIRGVRFKVGGDDRADSLSLRGLNVPSSAVVKAIRDPLRRKGITLTPESARVSLSIPGRGLLLELDSAGHYKFWVSRNASNLVSVTDAMVYFDGESLLSQSLSFPLMRFLQDEAERAAGD